MLHNERLRVEFSVLSTQRSFGSTCCDERGLCNTRLSFIAHVLRPRSRWQQYTESDLDSWHVTHLLSQTVASVFFSSVFQLITRHSAGQLSTQLVVAETLQQVGYHDKGFGKARCRSRYTKRNLDSCCAPIKDNLTACKESPAMVPSYSYSSRDLIRECKHEQRSRGQEVLRSRISDPEKSRMRTEQHQKGQHMNICATQKETNFHVTVRTLFAEEAEFLKALDPKESSEQRVGERRGKC